MIFYPAETKYFVFYVSKASELIFTIYQFIDSLTIKNKYFLKTNTPNCEHYYKTSISIPIHTLTAKDQKYIANKIKFILNETNINAL